jgi:hypothetical protein
MVFLLSFWCPEIHSYCIWVSAQGSEFSCQFCTAHAKVFMCKSAHAQLAHIGYVLVVILCIMFYRCGHNVSIKVSDFPLFV